VELASCLGSLAQVGAAPAAISLSWKLLAVALSVGLAALLMVVTDTRFPGDAPGRSPLPGETWDDRYRRRDRS
jgi:hypothetical protein